MDSNESKIPLKRAEISIEKFNNIGIPHHLGLLKNHKSNIEKCLALGDWDKIKKEEINATRVVKQLKTLLLEMDSLRSKIRSQDVDKFDELILKSRQCALDEIKGYLDMKLKAPDPSTSAALDDENEQLEETIPQIQTQYNRAEHQLKAKEACLAEFENLQREIEDLHSVFNKLFEHVEVQAESVAVIADNVDETQMQVAHGERSLRRALTYKKAMYPVCGALLGTCVGGPIGFLTGLKIGGLAAIGGGILGYTGGTVLKKQEQESLEQTDRKTE